MASYCTKCGSPLASSDTFCPSCSTAVPPAAANFQPVGETPVESTFTPVAAPVPNPLPPAASYPVSPTMSPATVSQSNGGALKIVLIVLAVVVALGLVAAGVLGYGAWRLAHSIQKDAAGNYSIPGGVKLGGSTGASAADLGVPIYPGATEQPGGMNLSSGRSSMLMAHYVTNDAQDQVIDFYKRNMGSDVVTSTSNKTTILTRNTSGSKDRTVVTIGPPVGDDVGKTTIVILRTTKKE